VTKYERIDLSSVARRAAEEALERRFGARHQPRPRWGGAKRPKRKAAAPAPAPKRLRACSICGELGHRADGARHKAAQDSAAAKTEAALPKPSGNASPGPVRSVAADGQSTPAAAEPISHQETALPAPVAAAAPTVRQPKPARHRSAAPAPMARRSFLPALPVEPTAPPAPLLSAADAAEVLAENEPEESEDEEEAPPVPVQPSAETGEADQTETAPAMPAAERLRWTPGPSGEDDEQVPAVAARLSRPSKYHAHTIAARPIAGERRFASLAVLSDEEAEAIVPRPRTRGDCANVPRPCPFVSCSHHLYLDTNEETGTIKLNHPGKEPWELAETCALDAAEAGGQTLEATGELLGITRERVRQVELRILEKLRRQVPAGTEADTPGPALRHPYGEVAA